jgi:hypothetical protein
MARRGSNPEPGLVLVEHIVRQDGGGNDPKSTTVRTGYGASSSGSEVLCRIRR